MSRTAHHRKQRLNRLGSDMWKRGPLASASKTTENLKLERRVTRHAANQEVRGEQVLQASMTCRVTGCWYGWTV
jgi:hypothetical protein